MTDGPYCCLCQIHRVLKAGEQCPVCLPTPVRTGPPARLPLDRTISTTAGEA